MAAATQGGIVFRFLSVLCLENSGSNPRDAQHNQSTVVLAFSGLLSTDCIYIQLQDVEELQQIDKIRYFFIIEANNQHSLSITRNQC